MGRGLTYDQFEVGDTFVTQARTVTEADVVNFAGLAAKFHGTVTEAGGTQTFAGWACWTDSTWNDEKLEFSIEIDLSSRMGDPGNAHDVNHYFQVGHSDDLYGQFVFDGYGNLEYTPFTTDQVTYS